MSTLTPSLLFSRVVTHNTPCTFSFFGNPEVGPGPKCSNDLSKIFDSVPFPPTYMPTQVSTKA